LNRPTQPKKRPTGIIVIAVLWTLVSIYNIYVSLSGIIGDLRVLPDLSNPYMPEWLRSGIPAEMMIGFFVLAYGFLTLLVVYGLYTAKPWSYDFALALPIFIIILNFAGMMLYASAPPELELRAAADAAIPFIVGNIVFLIFTWGYLMQPHVKQYLNQIPTPPTTPVPAPSTLPVPPPPEPVATPEEKRFCRYCGAEQKSDAVFCEKCGRKVG